MRFFLFITKRLFVLFTIVSICSCEENYSPEESGENIHILYSTVDNNGVVYEVNTKVAKLVHIDNFLCVWSSTPHNIDGVAWHIASESDLITMNERRERLNNEISKLGGDKLVDDIYWTDKISGSSEAKRYHLGYACSWYSAFTSSLNNARFVREIPLVETIE